MLECKEIVWANYPFTDMNGEKVRPAVVIAGKNSYGDIICLPITRTHTVNSFKLNSSHIEGKTDMDTMKLITMSYVSLEQPMTLEPIHFKTSKPVLAKITDAALASIKQQLIQMQCK